MSAEKPALQGNPGTRWGLGGGLLASLCCLGPTVAALLGLTGATFLFSLLKYRPYFLALGLIFMGAGVGLALRRSRQVCDVAQHRRNLWMFPSVALLSFGVSYVLLTYVTPTLVYRSLTPAASVGQPTQDATAAPQPAGVTGISAPDEEGGGAARSQPAMTVPTVEAAPAGAASQEPEAPAGVSARPRRATLAIEGMT